MEGEEIKIIRGREKREEILWEEMVVLGEIEIEFLWIEEFMEIEENYGGKIEEMIIEEI